MNNKKIKVLHIITKLELGGAQQNTLYTVENLNKEKFDVCLISGCGGILDEKAKLISKTKNVKLFFVKNLIREINPIKDFIALIELIILLNKIKPDIVHTHSSKAGILGRWATFFVNVIYKIRNKKNVKIIHTFHGFAFSAYHKFFIRWVYIFLEFFTAIISDKLIFVSNDNIKTAKMYKIGNLKKYILIRSGIKISNFYVSDKDKSLRFLKKEELGILEAEKVITTIGPFKPQKNLSDFIKIAKIISDKLSEMKIRFLIIGDGEQRNFLISLSKKLNVEEKIKFLSWQKNVKEFLVITDIFVMTSLWEGLPRSAVEALVCGVPVVAYSVDGLNDIIKSGTNGFLVKPKDIFSLAEKIIFLLTNNEVYNNIKKNTTQTIDKSFDIDYMVLQQENLYFELTSIIN
ncbi:MAG: glycosyltransferase family 4 protein [Endomicrobiia bacterium]